MVVKGNGQGYGRANCAKRDFHTFYVFQVNNVAKLDRAKKNSIFLKIESEHRQAISSKLPKSFRGACDLVVYYDFRSDFYGFLPTSRNSPSTTKSPVPLKLLGILLGIT